MVTASAEEPEAEWTPIDEIHRMMSTLAYNMKDIADHEPLAWYALNIWARADEDLQLHEDTKQEMLTWFATTVTIHDLVKKLYGDDYWDRNPHQS